MSTMGTPEPAPNPALPDDEFEEISVEITEENTVLVHGEDWELELSPAEARQLADALRDAAADAEADLPDEAA